MTVDGPLLVLAGAGSGKTRVITRRVAYMIQHGVAPWNILAITFTNKASQEMRERVEALGAPRGSTICTFHSLCVRLLREFALPAGLTPNFSIYDRDDQIKVVKEAVAALELSTENYPPARVLSAISTAKNALQGPTQMRDEATGFFQRQSADIFEKYADLLRGRNALDFDDLLVRTAFLLRDRPDILEALSHRYRYVMIDEYQDTNHAQYVIAHGIAMAHENLCATGDPDQSIYAWRGADIKNILEFEQDYPNAKVVRLEENYRSTAPILAAASSLIAHNSQRKKKDLWTRREGGANVRVVYCDNQYDEARLVASRVADYHAAGGRWDDVAVFYRVNSLSRLVEEQLFKAGTPYRVARGTEFYNRKEVKDVLAYLRVLVNPADDLSLLRIVNSPPRGIGETTMGKIADYAVARHIPVLEGCRQVAQAGLAAGTVAKVTGFVSLVDYLRQGLDRNVRAIMEDAIKQSGMENALAGCDEDHKQARANVEELVNSAAEFDERRQESEPAPDQPASRPIEEYLHQISLVSDVDHMEGSAGSVTLMTLHAAKGLEFPAVFIVGCEMGLLPFQRQDDAPYNPVAEAAKMEEERRLAFVGMTRAQDQLTLTCCRSRQFRGQTTPQTASIFLNEIGREAVEVEDATVLGRPARPAYRARGGFFGDSEERAAIEAMPAPRGRFHADEPDLAFDDSETPLPTEYQSLRKGSKVYSPSFGIGKVVSMSQPWPMTRVKVDFQQYGQKTLVLAAAKLEMV